VPNHHELPTYYLRGFVEAGTSFVWAYTRGAPFNPGTKFGNSPRRQGLRVTAIRADGYVAWTRDGRTHYDYEGALQRKERKADEVIAKVRSFGSVDRAEKEVLARYIGLTWRRLRERDVQILPVWERELAKSRLPEDAWRLAIAGKVDDARGLLNELRWMRTAQGKVDLLRETMMSDFSMVQDILLQLRWTFYRCPEDEYFITSDVAVTYDRAAGLRQSPLLFPLSSQVMLVGTRWGESDLTWEEASRENTRKFNAMVMFSANKHVFGPRPDEWISSTWERGLVLQ
jgi:hypothetical protein